MANGHIYIGFDASGLFKIGITNNLKARMRQYRSTNPTFQYLYNFPVESPAISEAELHARFGYCRKYREWFSLGPEDLEWIYKKFTGDNSHNSDDFFQIWHSIHFERMALHMSSKQNFNDFIKDCPECANMDWQVWNE